MGPGRPKPASSAERLPGPGRVHRFWFGRVDDWVTCIARNRARWFEHGRRLDGVVRERFAPLVEAAARGELSHWLDSPRGALALVLALDQFPRHIHRGSGRAFALDALARRACEEGIARGHDATLSAVECSFFYLPLEHAEDLDAQERCVRLMAQVARGGERDLQPFLREAHRYAREHRDIIARFGRFPHRNDALGRESTAEEHAYLASDAARFGQ